MVFVPGNDFIMGGEQENNEKPRHIVHVDGFYIAKYLVTNLQYAQFVTKTGHEPPQHWRAKTPPQEIWNHPVIYVAWDEAYAYCEWLSEVHGKKVRLPTEAEWEKAARGTDGREYPWGKGADPNKANYDDSKIGGTSPVGCFPNGQSPYGCLDMAGNAWEWTSTLYRPYPYRADDGREDPDSRNSRILRGGSWFNDRDRVRCTDRNWFNPRIGYSNVGLRLARTFT
jgi:formylglycine-generating enzyme required for sulfatase activity